MFGRKERKTPLKRQPLTNLEDLRDDCIALYINSGLTQRQIYEAGGPTTATISKWLHKETKFPRLDTVRAFLIAVDADLIAVPRYQADDLRGRDIATRLGLSISVNGRPKMPTKAQEKKRHAARVD